MRKAFLTCLVLLLCPVLFAQEAMSNDAVMKLLKAGLSQELVVTTINSSPGNYDTSANALIALKKGGAQASRVAAARIDEADKLLKKAHWNVKAAIVMQKTGLAYPKALTRLRKAHDLMRDAIGEDIEPRLRGMLQGAAEASREAKPV